MGSAVLCSRFAEEDLVIIEVAGELELERTIVDLSEVDFMDSAGASVLVVLARRSFLNQRDLALVSPEGPARRLMHIAGLDAVAPLYATLEQALVVGAGSWPQRGRTPIVAAPVDRTCGASAGTRGRYS